MFVFKMEDKQVSNSSLGELENIREIYRAKAFRLVIQIAFIFGIPAAIAYFAGTRIDSHYGTEKRYVLIALAISFVLSWIIMIFVYRKIDKQLKEVDKAIAKKKEERKKDGLLKPISEEN